MSGEIAYRYPVFIFLAVGVAVAIFVILMRLVSKPEKEATWQCLICGARFIGKDQDKFKFCPFCGTKRGSRVGPGRRTVTTEEDDYSDIDEELLS